MGTGGFLIAVDECACVQITKCAGRTAVVTEKQPTEVHDIVEADGMRDRFDHVSGFDQSPFSLAKSAFVDAGNNAGADDATKNPPEIIGVAAERLGDVTG